MCDLVTPYMFVRNTFQAQRKINFDKTFLMHPVNIYDKRFQRYKISDVINWLKVFYSWRFLAYDITKLAYLRKKGE